MTIFHGRMNDGTEVRALIIDINAFIQSDWETNIFVYNEESEVFTVKKKNVHWECVEQE